MGGVNPTTAGAGVGTSVFVKDTLKVVSAAGCTTASGLLGHMQCRVDDVMALSRACLGSGDG